MNTWEAGGKVNGFASVPESAYKEAEGIEKLVSGDLRTTSGVVNIPVCSFQQILDTVSAAADTEEPPSNPYYPCPPPA